MQNRPAVRTVKLSDDVAPRGQSQAALLAIDGLPVVPCGH